MVAAFGFNPATIGAISSVVGAVGGLFKGGSKSGSSKNDRIAANTQFNLNRQDQRRLIRTRVKDARAAGVHPLYALGVAGSPSPPTMVGGGGGGGESGSYLGDGLQNLGATLQNMPSTTQTKANIRATNASASRDEAAAALDLSILKRAEQAVNVTQDGGYLGKAQPGLVETVPSEVISANSLDPTTVAGHKPAFMSQIVGTDSNGHPIAIRVPYSDEGIAESIGSVGSLGLTALKNLGLLDQKRRKVDRRQRARPKFKSKKAAKAWRRKQYTH